MGKKEFKTNVMRVLDQKKIEYKSHSYADTDAISGKEVAEALGENPDRVFKTLVTQGNSRNYYVLMIPVLMELDLKKAAKAACDKSMELIPVRELLPLTGYIRGGCSPVGMKKQYPTHLDETAQLWEEIAVSAGERGHQMLLSPEKLAAFIGGEFVDLIL